MKKVFVFTILVFDFFALLAAQDFIPLKYVPTNLEIEVINVDISIVSTDDDFASYKVNLSPGKKLSCVLNRGTLRIRSVYETSGNITIKIPKKIERLRIAVALSNINISDLSIVHSHILNTCGDITISNSLFKTSNLTHNTGILNFEAGIKSSVICVTNSRASVTYLGESADYQVTYNQANSRLFINGEIVDKIQGNIGNSKALKHAMLSASASVVELKYPR